MKDHHRCNVVHRAATHSKCNLNYKLPLYKSMNELASNKENYNTKSQRILFKSFMNLLEPAADDCERNQREKR